MQVSKKQINDRVALIKTNEGYPSQIIRVDYNPDNFEMEEVLITTQRNQYRLVFDWIDDEWVLCSTQNFGTQAIAKGYYRKFAIDQYRILGKAIKKINEVEDQIYREHGNEE